MQKSGVEDLVRKVWETDCEGSLMYKVATKIKRCRVELLKWNRQGQGNAAKRIRMIQEKMERLTELGGNRDWNRCHAMKEALDQAYKDEEIFWSQKSRNQWLQEGDKNTKFFHASTIQKRKTNRLVQLEKNGRGWCESEEEVVDEISDYF